MLVGLMIIACLPSQDRVDGEQITSPDGRRSAYVADRSTDGWSTVYLREGRKTRDLLPGDVSGKLGSSGMRRIQVGVWLKNDELSFQYHCGTGCVSIYKINVDTGTMVELWTGAVDYGVYWSPRRDRALVGTHLGGLLMISSEGAYTTEVLGCRVFNYKTTGGMYLFESWSQDGANVLVRKVTCDDREALPSKGERLRWDGNNFSLPIQ